MNFAPAPCCAFLAAYRAVLPLADAALDLAAAYYGWARAHDLWLYEAIYSDGNDRLRQFIEPGGFVPLADRWEGMRRARDKSQENERPGDNENR